MSSSVYQVQAKKWSGRRPSRAWFDFTTNVVIIAKDKGSVKRFPCTAVSVEILRDEVTVRLVVDSMQYTKDIEFGKKYEAMNFCKQLRKLAESRGRAYRFFSDALKQGESELDLDGLGAAMRSASITPPQLFRAAKRTSFETFLDYFLDYGPKHHSLGTPSARGRPQHHRKKRTRSIGAMTFANAPTSTVMLPGEGQIIKPSNCGLVISEKDMLDGVITLTNYRLMWQENLTLDLLSIPVAVIERTEVKKRGKKLVTLTINCKDKRRAMLIYDAKKAPLSMLQQSLKMMAFPKIQTKMFAFAYKFTPSDAKQGFDGWSCNDFEKEYGRLGLLNKSTYLRVTQINKNYQFSESYPAQILVPGNITDEQLARVGKYRSRARIPAVVFIHPRTRATISRCAQPMAGIGQTRCSEDETLINSLRVINPNNNQAIYLYDARPKTAAMGNKVMGKGFENVSHYDSAVLEFCNIDNIHAVRKAYDDLMLLTLGPEPQDQAEFFGRLGQTKWLYHIRMILVAACKIARTVEEKQASCVVHCSDGWDRTSQLCALAQLIMDPHTRTARGFATLIEKEWISFGHCFEERIGHGREEIHSQRSPVFVQFIDCVWQLLRQAPTLFEFTEEFLIAVLDHVYDCRFGTFLFNWESQRKKADYRNKTVSLWSYMLDPGQADLFINKVYQFTPKEIKESSCYPSVDVRRIVLWEAYHMRYNSAYTDNSLTRAIAVMDMSRGAPSAAKPGASGSSTDQKGGASGGIDRKRRSAMQAYRTFDAFSPHTPRLIRLSTSQLRLTTSADGAVRISARESSSLGGSGRGRRRMYASQSSATSSPRYSFSQNPIQAPHTTLPALTSTDAEMDSHGEAQTDVQIDVQTPRVAARALPPPPPPPPPDGSAAGSEELSPNLHELTDSSASGSVTPADSRASLLH